MNRTEQSGETKQTVRALHLDKATSTRTTRSIVKEGKLAMIGTEDDNNKRRKTISIPKKKKKKETAFLSVFFVVFFLLQQEKQKRKTKLEISPWRRGKAVSSVSVLLLD